MDPITGPLMVINGIAPAYKTIKNGFNRMIGKDIPVQEPNQDPYQKLLEERAGLAVKLAETPIDPDNIGNIVDSTLPLPLNYSELYKPISN